jgi:hypothetical protein
MSAYRRGHPYNFLKWNRADEDYSLQKIYDTTSLTFSWTMGFDPRTVQPGSSVAIPTELHRPTLVHVINPLNAELNPICHLLVLLGDLTFMGPCIVSTNWFKYDREWFFLNHNFQTLNCMSVFNVLPYGVSTFFPTFWKHSDALFKKGLWFAACLHTNQSRSYLNHLVYSNIYPERCNVTHCIYIWKLPYVFQLLLPPIIRSAYNSIYSIWYLSRRYCYLPL